MLVVRTPPPPLSLRRLKPSPFRCYYHPSLSSSLLSSHMHLLTTVPRKLALPSFPTFTRIVSPKRGPFLTLLHDLFFSDSLISRLTFARFSQIGQLRRVLHIVVIGRRKVEFFEWIFLLERRESRGKMDVTSRRYLFDEYRSLINFWIGTKGGGEESRRP